MTERWGAVAGITAIGALVPISIILLGTGYPFADASTAEISEYFVAHRTAFMAVIILDLISVAAFVLFSITLRDALPTSWSAWASSAGVLTGLVTGLESMTFAAAGFDGTPAVIEPLWTLGHFGFGPLVHIFAASLLAAGSLALHQATGWPRWVTLLGWLGVLGNLIVPLGLFGHNVDLVAGMIEHLVGTVPWAAWTLAISIGLLRRHRSGSKPDSAADIAPT